MRGVVAPFDDKEEKARTPPTRLLFVPCTFVTIDPTWLLIFPSLPPRAPLNPSPQLHPPGVSLAGYSPQGHRPELEKKDPENVLLARQSRVRLPAELIRDEALEVSGPERAVFLDDHPGNLVGAAAVGMRTVLVGPDRPAALAALDEVLAEAAKG